MKPYYPIYFCQETGDYIVIAERTNLGLIEKDLLDKGFTIANIDYSTNIVYIKCYKPMGEIK